MEDIFLFLRDDAGGWVFLERTVSLLLAHLKMKRNLSDWATREWIMSLEFFMVEVVAVGPKVSFPPCPFSSGRQWLKS